MKRMIRKYILSAAALVLSAVLILFRTALLSCADDPDEEKLPELRVSDLTLFEGEDGETVEEDGESWFRYRYEDRIILEYREEAGEESVYYGLRSLPEELSAELSEKEPQSKDQPWEKGDHVIQIQLGSVSSEFHVQVIEKKIREIVPRSPVLLQENETGIYDLSDLELLVLYENTDYYESITLSDTENTLESEQEGLPWEAGTHPVNFSYQGFSGSFDAEVSAFPIQGWTFSEEQYWISESASDEESESGEGRLYRPEEFLTVSVVRFDGSTTSGTLKKIAENFHLDYSLKLKSGETEMRFKTGDLAEIDLEMAGISQEARIRISEYEQSVCPHAHTEDSAEIPADCAHTGWTAFTRCLDCGSIVSGYRTMLKKTEHEKARVCILKAPACEEKGLALLSCSVCHEMLTEEIPETGHDFGPFAVVKEATEDEDGLQKRVCQACGKEEEEVITKTGSEESSSEEESSEESSSEGSSEEESSEESSEEDSEEPSSEEESGSEESTEESSEESSEETKSEEASVTTESETETETETSSETTTEKETTTEAPTTSAAPTTTETPTTTEASTTTAAPTTAAAATEEQRMTGSEQTPIDVEIRSGEEDDTEETYGLSTESPKDDPSKQSLLPERSEESTEEPESPGHQTAFNLILIGIGILTAVLFIIWILFMILRKKKK